MFGLFIGSSEETTAGTTTSTTFQQFMRYTTPSVAAGDYLIQWFYIWNHDATTSDFEGRVQVDDTTDLIDPSGTGIHKAEPKDAAGGGVGGSTQRYTASGMREVTLTAATHNIDIDYRTDVGGTSSTIYHGVIVVWRVG
jgi:hypothetical protein